MNGKTLADLYKNQLSGYHEWAGMKKLENGCCYIAFPQNVGPFLSIDETALSRDQVFTFVTNKGAHGGKGTLVAMISGTRSADIISVLEKEIPLDKRKKVSEITCDLSSAMMEAARTSFPKAYVVNDRFHVQQLFTEAMDEIRIVIRHLVRNEENKRKELCIEAGQEYVPQKYNGETMPQILLRTKQALIMAPNKLSVEQQKRLDILFEYYPQLKQAYDLMAELRNIYNMKITMTQAGLKMAKWFDKVLAVGNESFNSVVRTFKNNYKTILAYFKRRSTNASAESFNAKVKVFRTQLRGVCDTAFFVFRLQKLFA